MKKEETVSVRLYKSSREKARRLAARQGGSATIASVVADALKSQK